MISHKHATKIGFLVKKAAKLRGGGSALPGLIVERLNPRFLKTVLQDLPGGVVVITGTNGKTTTTKMVVELLRASGLKVFTNKTGSNFTRGVIASVLSHVDADGKLDVDIAVLELDEAYAVHFCQQVAPKYTLLLNVMRDQLDRFGEIDHTARLLEKVALATTGGVVLNRDDVLVRNIAKKIPKSTRLRYFGLHDSLQKVFPSDHDLYGTADVPVVPLPHPRSTDVILMGLKSKVALFAYGEKTQLPTPLKIDGVYNVLNAAAALALARMVLGEKAQTNLLLDTLSSVKPAFGRGEAIAIDGYPLEIVLVKNPSGFRLALSSYARRPASTMIAINDNYADGRDMSWLWDVDFSKLKQVKLVSGTRAYDMAVRLQYDLVEVVNVEPSLVKATASLLTCHGPKRIFCTYTSMMKIRKILSQTHHLEAIE